jgi:hypothetical protein
LGEGKQYLLTKGTLVQIVIGTTLARFLEEKEFGDGRPWRTVHEPRLAHEYSRCGGIAEFDYLYQTCYPLARLKVLSNPRITGYETSFLRLIARP